ncbi:nucleotide sugar dehydrogenase [Micromonospora sp. DT229]|uniref:nucleotide sugar dehydrogenase n=1 Tax=Micromonospora sp. DT229 TaxID=3393430 RepID=UPI003CF9FA0D
MVSSPTETRVPDPPVGADIAVSDFDRRIASRKAVVGIVGLGYTGLPLATGFAAAGFSVVGLDTDAEKINAIVRGESYLPDVSDLELEELHPRLSVGTSPDTMAVVDAVVVCVPTPTSDGVADLSHVDEALAAVVPHLRPGTLLVLQSTIPPGTTSAAARRLASEGGIRIGVDLYLAMAPERINPANADGWRMNNTPKLVGGFTAECTRRATMLFEQVCERVHPVSSPEVAELAKVFENTFRLVNIALTLELSDLCRQLRIPVREVIDAAATKPYGFLAHYPGPGVGGECIPVDPLFLQPLAKLAGTDLSLVQAAHRRIAERPSQVIDRIGELLVARGRTIQQARVLIVGVSYKEGVADLRNAPALDIIRGLRRRGAMVSYYDPLVPSMVLDGQAVPVASWTPKELSAQDCVVLVTPHNRIAADPHWSAAPLVLDTRNVLASAENVEIL